MNLLALLRNRELSFEMRAGSDLENVLVSVVIMAVDVVSVDLVNLALSGFVVVVEALTSEVGIRG